ncbi:MAG: plastocyanin/azurin family copper-binding protein [Gammaproteobacteria bacterium]
MKMVKIGVFSLALAASVAASAAEIAVIAGPRNFDPIDPDLNISLVKAQPGDTISWKNMSTHNTKSIEVPEGAQHWEGKLNEDFHVTLDKPGAYVYECVPHASMGMVGVVLVGDGKPANLDAINASSNPLVKRMGKKLAKMFP